MNKTNKLITKTLSNEDIAMLDMMNYPNSKIYIRNDSGIYTIGDAFNEEDFKVFKKINKERGGILV